MTQHPDIARLVHAADAPQAEVVRWLTDYVCRPHPQLGRDGAVCPFVEPAARGGTMQLHTRTGLAAACGDELRALVRETARTFRSTPWARTNPTMRCLILVLPDLPQSHWHQLDSVQAELKPELAGDGLMLGQFHPDCPEPAARNPGFPISRSPVPLLAMRNMALHDVLFLHHDPELFHQYRLRFGARYERDVSVDQVYQEAYRAGTARFRRVSIDKRPGHACPVSKTTPNRHREEVAP